MRKILLLFGIYFLCCCNTFAQGVKFEKISLEQALAQAKAEGKFVFVDVTASWCAPCQLMAKEVLTVKEVGDYCNEQFVCIQMDVDQPEGKEFKKKYGVKFIPMFFILQEDGVVRHWVQGSRSPDDFLAWAKRGVNETSSFFFLNNLLKKGQEMSLQNWADYYMVLKDTRKSHEADSIREDLFQHVPLVQLAGTECWSFFREESYGSKYFNYVIEHRDEFRKKQGEKSIDDYFVREYKKELQRLMYEAQTSPEAFGVIERITGELSDRGIILEQDKAKTVLAWGKETKAFLENDIPGMIEGMKELVELKEWRDCLWKAMVYVGTQGSNEEKENMGSFTSDMLFESAKDIVEQWDFYQKFRYLGFPVSCTKQFWMNALQQMKEKDKPLLLECVRCKDAYFVNRNWAWDISERIAFLDSLCVSVRIDMDDPEVAFLRDQFKVTTYPAYFLLDKNGEVKYSWEGMIGDDKLFRESVLEGLKKTK